MLVDGNAALCSSASDERDGHGSTARRTGGEWTGPGAIALAPVTVDDVALATDAVLVDLDRGEPPQPVTHAHPITAITEVQRIRWIG